MKNDTLKGQYRINEQIRAKEVRIVGDEIEPKVYPIFQALKMAEEKELDLVEISLLEKDGTPLKEYICLHFIPVFQESSGMFQLKVVIMIVSLRSETDFLYVHFYLLRFLLLLAFL